MSSVPLAGFTRRRRSPRRGDLARAFGKRWELVALEWDAKAALNYADIAAAWNVALKHSGSGHRFTRAHVRDAVAAAREWQRAERFEDLGSAAERVAAARLVLAALGVSPTHLEV